jgi:hypothetical protein
MGFVGRAAREPSERQGSLFFAERSFGTRRSSWPARDEQKAQRPTCENVDWLLTGVAEHHRGIDRAGGALPIHDCRAVLAGPITGLPAGADVALRQVARWLEDWVSKPDPALGRTGEVCPWTRRTIDLGKLELVPVGSNDADEVSEILQALLERFVSTEPTRGADASFRSIVAIFHRLHPASAGPFMVAAHSRSKPSFLARGLMLGEFYPTCDKPGLRNPTFRPLRSPVPLLVIRQMVEADVEFLLDKDEFVEAYLAAQRSRGVDRLQRVLEQRPPSLPQDRIVALRRIVEEYGPVSRRPSSPV